MLEAMNLMKILVDNVGIGHRDLNTGMAKQLLNIDDIGIISQQVGSERMTECVGMDILREAGFRRRIFDNHLDDAGMDPVATFLLFRNEQCWIRIIAEREIFIEVLVRNRINKTDARLVAFPDHRKAIDSVLNL